MIAKIIAGLMVRQTMLEAARDKNEETIKLVKKPGEKGSNKLDINVSLNCSKDRILIYLKKIIKSAARMTNVSFDEMINHLKITHELIDDVSREESNTTKEGSSEDQQGQQPNHDA